MAKISSKIKPDSIYSIKDNTFFAVPKENPKDLIKKEIGDSKVPTEFLPQTKIMRWDNEVNFSVRLVHNEASPVISKVGETVKWSGKKIEAKFYDINSEEHPEGASEFEVVLKEKPLTNVVEFTLNTKGLDFFYQPEIEDSEVQSDVKLTPKELLAKKREMRPENVVGSYAVYASENKVNYVGGKEYKCGKVGHIYRPQIEDSAGNKVWGELNIENGLLKVTIPQDFLDKAVYPVKHAAGLTFGYTSIGASEMNGGGTNLAASSYVTYSPASDGTLNSISAYIKASGTTYVRYALYNSSKNLVSNASDTKSLISSSYSWKELSNSGTVTSSSSYYLFWAISDSNLYIKYDSNATNGTYFISSLDSNWPSSFTYSNSHWKNNWSIYATYTAGGGSSAPTVTTQSVSSIASTTATGNGNVTADGGATVTERGVCWGTSTNPTIAGNHSAATAGGTGVFTASITSLSAKTHYYVRAYATNSVGTSYGDNVEFDTSGDFILADETSSSSIENITLAQAGGTLSIADESSASNIDNIILEYEGGTFEIADETSGATIDNVTLQFQGNFEIANEDSLSNIDNITLERNGGDFIITDENSASSIENITLGQSGDLLPADESSVSLIDNITLEQNGGTLAVGDITSTPEIDNIALIGNFIIGDVVYETTTEEITLEFEGGTLVIEDISSTSEIDNIPLVGDFIIQDIHAPPAIGNIVITSPDISTMNKNVFITQGGLALQTGGLRIPTCITAERPTALKGSLIYNTELNSLEIYDGSNWVTV